MMNKEKLIDLIKQKGNIYWVKERQVRMKIELSLANITPREKDCILNYKHLNNFTYLIPYEELTDNEEDAKWFLEFGKIERTERLELRTWEEFSKWDKSIKFSNNSTKYSMYVFVKNKNTKNCRIIIYADNGEQDWLVFEQPLTQENYTLACRKAKELFLGE